MDHDLPRSQGLEQAFQDPERQADVLGDAAAAGASRSRQMLEISDSISDMVSPVSSSDCGAEGESSRRKAPRPADFPGSRSFRSS